MCSPFLRRRIPWLAGRFISSRRVPPVLHVVLMSNICSGKQGGSLTERASSKSVQHKKRGGKRLVCDLLDVDSQRLRRLRQGVPVRVIDGDAFLQPFLHRSMLDLTRDEDFFDARPLGGSLEVLD